MQFNYQGLQSRRELSDYYIDYIDQSRETWTAIHLNEKIKQEVTYLRVN